MKNSLQGRDDFPQSNSNPSKEKQQNSEQNPPKDEYLQFPYSSQQSQPSSVQVITSQQNHPKVDYLPPSSQVSDQTKQLQASNGVSSHKSSNQPQIQLPSAQTLSLPQNPPKSNHNQPPSSQTPVQFQTQKEDLRQQKPSFGTSVQSKKQEPAKVNQDVLSNESSNQPQHGKQFSSAQVPPLEQNPGKSDTSPPSNQTSHHFEPKQPQNGVSSGTYPSKHHSSSNQQQQQQPPTEKKSPNQFQQQQPPTEKKSPNQSQQQQQPSAQPFPASEQVTSTVHGNPPPSQPPSVKKPGYNEPVLVFPDPDQRSHSATAAPPRPAAAATTTATTAPSEKAAPPKKSKGGCCSIL
ncbi:hypothetical protein COLO4_05805 [Corchorus olitorius]|uniref:Uncharacterized protein n=1 Tax=Corchorus olitorius TaxID=93759 RepID=A0A1R3KPW2_9ROSI|nr:hypothetical protein COLO4_05805 [Corchorus olitorius]